MHGKPLKNYTVELAGEFRILFSQDHGSCEVSQKFLPHQVCNDPWLCHSKQLFCIKQLICSPICSWLTYLQ